VSSEEDASIALQVSNALTQALLQYRMQNLEEVRDLVGVLTTNFHIKVPGRAQTLNP
jgi:hypothetical protein